MTLLYTDDIYLDHDPGPYHPESADRLRAIHQRLQLDALGDRCAAGALRPATVDEVCRNHDRRYVDAVEAVARAGGGALDPDTRMSRRSYEAALCAAGAAVSAVDEVVGAGRDTNALCLVRPPGHHACRTRAMGFCLFNNIGIAAHHACAVHGLERVLIVDWDVHHGNGTQESFYADPHVFYLSIHRYPFYPGSGAGDETGEGAGEGTVFNVPVPYGTRRDAYMDQFQSALDHAAQRCRPELVLVSAGFDAHAVDPIAGLCLEADDFADLTRRVLDVAHRYADGRLISTLEGGYDLTALADSVASHLGQLLDA